MAKDDKQCASNSDCCKDCVAECVTIPAASKVICEPRQCSLLWDQLAVHSHLAEHQHQHAARKGNCVDYAGISTTRDMQSPHNIGSDTRLGESSIVFRNGCGAFWTVHGWGLPTAKIVEWACCCCGCFLACNHAFRVRYTNVAIYICAAVDESGNANVRISTLGIDVVVLDAVVFGDW